MSLKIGSNAPDFTLKSSEGLDWNYYDLTKGKKTVVYFYPKDFTPGCTTEACSFRDKYGHFAELNIPVIGISRDSVALHKKFKEHYNLPFELLSDPDGWVADKYEALIPIVKITKRVSYLINENKEVIGSYTNFFNAEQHIKTMLKATKS